MSHHLKNYRPCPHCNVEVFFMRNTCRACGAKTMFREEMAGKRSDFLQKHYLKTKNQSKKWDNAHYKKKSIMRLMAELEGLGYASVLLVVGKEPTYRLSYLSYNDILHNIFENQEEGRQEQCTKNMNIMLNYLRNEYISRIEKGELPNKLVASEGNGEVTLEHALSESISPAEKMVATATARFQDECASLNASVESEAKNKVRTTGEKAQANRCTTLKQAANESIKQTEKKVAESATDTEKTCATAVASKPKNGVGLKVPKRPVSRKGTVKRSRVDASENGDGVAMDSQGSPAEESLSEERPTKKRRIADPEATHSSHYPRKTLKTYSAAFRRQKSAATVKEVSYPVVQTSQVVVTDEGSVVHGAANEFIAQPDTPQLILGCPEVMEVQEVQNAAGETVYVVVKTP